MLDIIEDVLEKVDTIKNSIFAPEECMLQEFEITGREDYEILLEYHMKYKSYEDIINDIAWQLDNHTFIHKSYCAVCGKDQKMIYSGISQEEQEKWPLHFREDLFCPECHCNARLRYMVQKLKKEYTRGMKTYLYERKTATYYAVSQFIPEDDLVGSEYFGDQYCSGEYVDGILHEDATNLSFENDSFDLLLSMDVFEHVYLYKEALREAYRVLKPGGKMLLTIPVYGDLDKTYLRAEIVDGELVHLHSPKYHGNPMNPSEGVLEFVSYGWDIIDIIKEIGFSDVRLIAYMSINEGYLGHVPFYFELVK